MKNKMLREIPKDELKNILGGEGGEIKPINLAAEQEKQEEDCLFKTCESCVTCNTCQTAQGGGNPDTMQRMSVPLLNF